LVIEFPAVDQVHFWREIKMRWLVERVGQAVDGWSAGSYRFLHAVLVQMMHILAGRRMVTTVSKIFQPKKNQQESLEHLWVPRSTDMDSTFSWWILFEYF
jgi:hypothetical protein